MQCKQGRRQRTGSATHRVAEPHECPFHTWPWHWSGGRAHRQPRTEVLLPCIACALGNCNSSALRRAAPRRSDTGEAPGFVGSCRVHPSGCRSAVVVPSASLKAWPAHMHSHPGKSRWRDKGKLSAPVPPKRHYNFPSLYHPACLVVWHEIRALVRLRFITGLHVALLQLVQKHQRSQVSVKVKVLGTAGWLGAEPCLWLVTSARLRDTVPMDLALLLGGHQSGTLPDPTSGENKGLGIEVGQWEMASESPFPS